MGILSDIGHALTGTKTDSVNRSDRENEERRAANRRASRNAAFGGDGSVSYRNGNFVNSNGEVVSDEAYDSQFGKGSASAFRQEAATAWVGQSTPPPTADSNENLAATEETLANLDQPSSQRQPRNVSASTVAFNATLPRTGAQPRTMASARAPAPQLSSVDMSEVSSDLFPTVVADDDAAGTGTSEKVSDLLGGVGTYQNRIAGLAGDQTGLSVAEAQLAKATALANTQAAINTEASQRSALGAARGVRNRGDRALAERQAIGESAYIGQDAARTDALRQASATGDLAVLRATEADADRRFKLDALKTASDLGLNTAALEVDISRVNIERMQLDLGYAQLDQQQAQNILGFTRDMAAIEFQYDQLAVQDQNEADQLLMQKYQIDEDTMFKLKQLKASQQVNWGQVLTSFAAGAGQGATTALATMSDERAKTSIAEVSSTASEFEELMGALSANTYEYKEPDRHGYGLRFGFMAQDLDKTKLGKHIVKPDAAGFKTIDVAPLALATASGLGLIYDRLKDLEKAVRS